MSSSPSPAGASFLATSPELRLMRRPFAAYAALAAEEDPRPLLTLVERIMLIEIVMGCSLSFVAAGRLTPRLVAGSGLSWAMAPLLQIAVALGARRFAPSKWSAARALSLHFAGNGPWMFFLAAGAALCLFTPDVYAAFRASLSFGILPGALVLAAVWSWFLTYAFYRAASGLSRRRALALVAFEVLAKAALIVAWYMFLDDIVPQLRGPSA